MGLDVRLNIGALSIGGALSTYSVQKEVYNPRIVTTRDGVEHVIRQDRDVISFRMLPMTDAFAALLYNALKENVISVEYTSPYINANITGDFRLASSIDSAFGLRSVDGNRYYKGGEIVLRRLDVNAAGL